MQFRIRLAAVVGALLLGATGAQAQIKMSGSFVADKVCAAKQAIRGDKNPGNIETQAGQSYDLLGANKTPPTHYWVRVPGAQPEQRWVAVDCGHVDGAAAAPAASSKAGARAQPTGKPEYVLALSWQPAFCETKPDKTECKSQTATRFDATHFTLHGLWPQPNGNFYCGVSAADKANDKPGSWDELPMVSLSTPIREDLNETMPGTQSDLDRHESIKHGTCYGKDQNAYFADALRLTDEVNASDVRTLLAGNIGNQVSAQDIRAAFDEAFGQGAGDRVRVSCARDKGRRLIGELTIGLTGPVTDDKTFKDLIMAAAPTKDAGCPVGIVDQVGLQ